MTCIAIRDLIQAAYGTFANGPMLQKLLEERFDLKLHRETRERPIYRLEVAAGGPKLQPTKAGSCAVPDFEHPQPPSPGQPPFCGRTSYQRNGATRVVDALGTTMAAFAGTTLSARLDLDRPVVDRTGLAGRFDTLSTALRERLGLKLTAARSPVEVLVVDHVERPTAD